MPRLNINIENISRRSPSGHNDLLLVSPITSRLQSSHKRDLSTSSTDSCLTDGSLATLDSEKGHSYDEPIIIVEDETADHHHHHQLPVLRKDKTRTRPRPFSSLLSSLSFRSVSPSKPLTAPARHVVWKASGLLNQMKLDQVVRKEKGRGRIVSFKMNRGSYLGCYALRETIDYLGIVIPEVREVGLVSQIYFLEELELMTPLLTRFENLQKLSIYDASDDPPVAPGALCAMIARWAIECPSLHEVRFGKSSVWRREVTPDERGRVGNETWVEVKIPAQ
ncbi:hypothetical protein FRB96_001445 [Tulasnella sp. 330]|nr:hypothetical protein FRB96_001445 [Tulasnella sp. 330]